MVQRIEDYWLYNISNWINWRRSQTSILYIRFPVFFFANTWKHLHRSPWKYRELLELFLGCQSICGIRPSLIFFGWGAWHHVCNTRTCTPKILYFHVFLEKGHLSLPAKGKKFMFSGGKKPSFQIIQERSCPSAALFEKTIFSGSLMKISYFRAFLQQRTV